jgi:hypothetical protein
VATTFLSKIVRISGLFGDIEEVNAVRDVRQKGMTTGRRTKEEGGGDTRQSMGGVVRYLNPN